MSRVWRVVRIQLVNAPAVLGLPVLVLLLVLAANIALFAAIGDAAPPDGNITGAVISIYGVMLAVHLQTMTQVFPFALGLSVTRRTFFEATSVVVAAQALGYGVLLYLLSLLERGTDGWWLRLKVFQIPFLDVSNPLLQILVYTVPFLFVSFLGVFLGVVFKRWGQLGVWVLAIGAGGALSLAAILITWQRWWPAVGEFFAGQSALALFVGYPFVLAALLAGAGYLTLRRATA
ncbi:hypothetical protein ABZ863_19610 [Saccharomonospora sp. NPDC046836]|uniref:hypothetical protein n=1 Tax=Saccharomonospora sp. NPDC046836 TaxID=3156921 RepID=UPI0033D13D66